MTWVAPVHYPPKKLIIPPGKLTFKAQKYCDEFIIKEITSDEGMVLEGYAAGHPIKRSLQGNTLISVDGKQIKSLEEDLPAECDKSREVVVQRGVNSQEASEHTKGRLMYYKDINCGLFRILDYSNVEKKYGKEFLDELNPPQRKTGNELLLDAFKNLAEYNFNDDDKDVKDEQVPMDVCASCGNGKGDNVKLKTCTACKLVRYCSVQCQKNHRPQHKTACNRRAAQIEEERSAKDFWGHL